MVDPTIRNPGRTLPDPIARRLTAPSVQSLEGFKNQPLCAELAVRLLVAAAENLEGVEEIGKLLHGQFKDMPCHNSIQLSARSNACGWIDQRGLGNGVGRASA